MTFKQAPIGVAMIGYIAEDGTPVLLEWSRNRAEAPFERMGLLHVSYVGRDGFAVNSCETIDECPLTRALVIPGCYLPVKMVASEISEAAWASTDRGIELVTRMGGVPQVGHRPVDPSWRLYKPATT